MVRQPGHQRPHGVHRVPGGQRPHHTDDGGRERSGPRELGLKVTQFGPGGQAAMPQQVADLLEGGLSREIVNIVPTICQHAALPVEVAKLGGGRDDPLEPGDCACLRRHRLCSRSWRRRAATGPSPLPQAGVAGEYRRRHPLGGEIYNLGTDRSHSGENRNTRPDRQPV